MTENTLKLQEEIKRHNVLYYQKNKPEITDAEYDELVKKACIQTVGAEPDDRFSNSSCGLESSEKARKIV